MARDDDDLFDEEDDLDEDELEDRREERRYYEEAKQRMIGRLREAETKFIGGLFLSGSDYLKQRELQPVRWMVEGFIPCGALIILGGNSKSGKTCLATALAMAVAKGEPFLGANTSQSPVLWCAFEESREERLELLAKFVDVPDHFYTTHNAFKIDSEFGEKALRIWSSAFSSPPLIVVDPLFGATDANLAEGRAARKALMGLKRLAAKISATVLVIHHVNKDTAAGLTRERFAESNQLLATASMDILMDSRDLPDGSREIRLHSRGRGDHANRTRLLRSTGPTHFELLGSGAAGASKDAARVDAILAHLRASEVPLATEALAKACGLALQSTRNRVYRLLKEGLVTVAQEKGRTRYYSAVS